MLDDPVAPFRRAFDTARDPYTARNALGIIGSPISDAPSDGHYYVRRNAAWADSAPLFQPLDGDLTSLAAASSVAIYYRSAANTWSPVTIGSGLTFSSGTLDAPLFGSSAQGEVPASGGGTTNYLRADGTWTVPGGGNVSNSGTPTVDQFAVWVDATHIKGTTGIKGVTTNSNAAAGDVGEYVEQTFLSSGSGVSVTASTYTSTCSISLTAGDWDVVFEGFLGINSTTNFQLYAIISTTANAFADLPNLGIAVGFGGLSALWGVGVRGPCRFSLASTTTIYGTIYQSSSVTATWYGTIHARRVR